jgi:transposase-like protein
MKNSMMTPPQRTQGSNAYSPEFIHDIVLQSEDCENIGVLAWEYGLTPGLVFKWREEFYIKTGKRD